MAKELEPAEDYVLKEGNKAATEWLERDSLPAVAKDIPVASIMSAAAMVAAVRRFDRSSGRQMRAAIWISIIALLVSIGSLIIALKAGL